MQARRELDNDEDSMNRRIALGKVANGGRGKDAADREVELERLAAISHDASGKE